MNRWVVARRMAAIEASCRAQVIAREVAVGRRVGDVVFAAAVIVTAAAL